MTSAIGIAALAGALLTLAAPPAAAMVEDATVRVVIKFVKRTAAAGVRFDAASCPDCTVVTDVAWNAENPRETVVALAVPRRRMLEAAFAGNTANVRRVIVESGDIAFRREDGRLVVPLPPLSSDAITAGEMATHIVEPGMVLRFEHADPARRAGPYAQGAFPTLQRRAADTLEFAQREAVRELGLGQYAVDHGLGRIQIMGFDTNAPHGHLDGPPHVHMHLRWPANTGTQIGHYYIGTDGLLTHNIVGVKDIDAEPRRFGRGERFVTVGPDGRPAYSNRITAEGSLEIGRADGASCRIDPAGADGTGGFATGARVSCAGSAPRAVTVSDDLSRGKLTVHVDRIAEVFAYDPDTGALLSPTAPPPPPSVFTPAAVADRAS